MWTPERLAKLALKELRSLHDNALRKNAIEVVSLCEQELACRASIKTSRAPTERIKSDKGSIVIGYHFVCKNSKGVIDNNNGTFWTGSWVVARKNVDESIRYGAYVALHESKDKPSYRQGQILEYRLRERDMVDRDNIGIEFKIAEDDKPRLWVGDGSAEKGYNWRQPGSKIT